MASIRREVFVGLINGMICAILINFVGILWFGLPSLGYVIGLAMVMIMVVAGFTVQSFQLSYSE